MTDKDRTISGMPYSNLNEDDLENQRRAQNDSQKKDKSTTKKRISMPGRIEYNSDKILNRIDAVRGSVSIGLFGSNAAEVTNLEFSILGVAITELLAAVFYAVTIAVDYIYKRKEKRNLLAAKRLQHYQKYKQSRLDAASRHKVRRSGLLPDVGWFLYDHVIGRTTKKKKIKSDGSSKEGDNAEPENLSSSSEKDNSKTKPISPEEAKSLVEANILTEDELYYEIVSRNNKTFGFTNNYFMNLSRLAVLAASITGGILLLLFGLSDNETIEDASQNERLMLEAAIWLIAGSLGFSRIINGEIQEEVDSDEWRATFKDAVKKIKHTKKDNSSGYQDGLQPTSKPPSALIPPKYYVPKGLKLKSVQGGGHCFFAAVAEQQPNESVDSLRRKTAAYLNGNFAEFKPFFTGSENAFKAYIEAIKNSNEWAGHIEIRALAKEIDRPIIVVQTNKRYYEQNLEDDEDVLEGDKEPIFVSYNGTDHYDALTLTGDSDWQKVLKRVRAECKALHSITPASPEAINADVTHTPS